MRPTPPLAFLLAFLASAGAVVAQGLGEPEVSTYVPAQPLERPAAVYPPGPLGMYREGWVALSFVILPTGDVTEAMVEESSGGEAFERAALRAVERWKYEPATRDGVPVEQAMVQTIIRFRLYPGDYVERASQEFVRNYRELVRLVNGQDFQAAAVLLAAMETQERLNRYETAWLWWAKYVYLSRASPSDVAGMRRALERAVGYDESMYLAMDQFVAAAERLVILHAQALDIASAIATFERLRDEVADFGPTTKARAQSYAQSIAGLQPGYEAMLELVKSDELLLMNGSVGEFDYWVHDLLRPSFSLAEIKGRLDALDIRCERGRQRYDSVPVETVWRVPEDWGACGIYLKGEPGTTFAFREYPRSYAAPAAVDVGAKRPVSPP